MFKYSLRVWFVAVVCGGLCVLTENAGAAASGTSGFTPLVGSATTSLTEDFLRIKTDGLVAGEDSFNRIFNEFETTAVPEPSSAIAVLLIGVCVAGRRKRMVPR